MCFCTARPAWVGPNPSVFGALPYPPRSRPAQNPRPAPVRTTTRHAWSTAMASSAACRPCTSPVVSAFSFSGRFIVMRVTPG